MVVMVDLDGTLIDTKEVNFMAYSDALMEFNYKMDRDYYYKHCNGRHYLEFLPALTSNEPRILTRIHDEKKRRYQKYLHLARPNMALIRLLSICKRSCKIALVTTASKANAISLLEQFDLLKLFDLLVTGDDVKNRKPDPEGYFKAMDYFGVSAQNAVVFEDSDLGIQAANAAGITCFEAIGFN